MLPVSRIAGFDPSAPRRQAQGVGYRGGDLADLEAVTSLVHVVYGGEVDSWRRRMHRALSRQDYCLVLASADGEPVGYGKANWCEPHAEDDQAPAGMYLTGLVVAPAWRRCGIGEQLTRRRLAWVWQRHRSAWFFTNADNRASVALHTRLGFTETGRAASYLGEPFQGGVGVLMRADSPAADQRLQ